MLTQGIFLGLSPCGCWCEDNVEMSIHGRMPNRHAISQVFRIDTSSAETAAVPSITFHRQSSVTCKAFMCRVKAVDKAEGVTDAEEGGHIKWLSPLSCITFVKQIYANIVTTSCYYTIIVTGLVQHAAPIFALNLERRYLLLVLSLVF